MSKLYTKLTEELYKDEIKVIEDKVNRLLQDKDNLGAEMYNKMRSTEFTVLEIIEIAEEIFGDGEQTQAFALRLMQGRKKKEVVSTSELAMPYGALDELAKESENKRVLASLVMKANRRGSKFSLEEGSKCDLYDLYLFFYSGDNPCARKDIYGYKVYNLMRKIMADAKMCQFTETKGKSVGAVDMDGNPYDFMSIDCNEALNKISALSQVDNKLGAILDMRSKITSYDDAVRSAIKYNIDVTSKHYRCSILTHDEVDKKLKDLLKIKDCHVFPVRSLIPKLVVPESVRDKYIDVTKLSAYGMNSKFSQNKMPHLYSEGAVAEMIALFEKLTAEYSKSYGTLPSSRKTDAYKCLFTCCEDLVTDNQDCPYMDAHFKSIRERDLKKSAKKLENNAK